jgi:hypothetical protein
MRLAPPSVFRRPPRVEILEPRFEEDRWPRRRQAPRTAWQTFRRFPLILQAVIAVWFIGLSIAAGVFVALQLTLLGILMTT